MYEIGHTNWGDMNCVSGKSKKHKAIAENEKISVSVLVYLR